MKIISIAIILLASVAVFVMSRFGTPIDSVMLRNIIESNTSEAGELLSFSFLLYFFLLGLLPTALIYFLKITHESLKKTISSQVKTLGICLALIAFNIFLLSKNYASFFREHKILRAYVNPIHWIYSIHKLATKKISAVQEHDHLGVNSKVIHHSETPKNEIIILVVGETVRADHISLNGYEKETFPLLAKENIYSLKQMSSCGTSTAVSVPCMFSLLARNDFDVDKAKYIDNTLDILQRDNKVRVLWRDNNSDSKGVALRVDYQDFKFQSNNSVCDTECRDIGMLVGLDEYIREHSGQDILIVLHQMGNHGPSYSNRYPKEFERFTPSCHTNELSDCSNEEISNAYDNALLYTDYFLSNVITLLKKYPDSETGFIYMSDHGESLGENGIYLHSMPYVIAPNEQTHVASFMWFGGTYENRLDVKELERRTFKDYSHDNLSHTMLGLFEIETSEYNSTLDILKGIINHDDD